MELQAKILKLVDQRGLSKTRFAEELGIARDSVYNLNENSKLSTILKACEILEVSILDLISDEKTDLVAEAASNYSKRKDILIDLKPYKNLQLDLQKKTIKLS